MEFNNIIIDTHSDLKFDAVKNILKKYNIKYNKIQIYISKKGINNCPIDNEVYLGVVNRMKSIIEKKGNKEDNNLFIVFQTGYFKLFLNNKWYEKCICHTMYNNIQVHSYCIPSYT